MRAVPIEGEVGEKSQFSGEQDLALAYNLVPRMETVSGVSNPTRIVSNDNQILCSGSWKTFQPQKELRIAIVYCMLTGSQGK